MYYYKHNDEYICKNEKSFIKYKIVEDSWKVIDEDGNPILDENGNQIIEYFNVEVEDGLLDDYEEITEEEYNNNQARLTEEQLRKLSLKKQIRQLQKKLDDSDYKAIKYGEGLYTEEEYAPIKQEREAFRVQIRELTKELDA